MVRALGDGYELDDDPARIDVDAVHAYISGESYWGRGRPRELVQRTLTGSHRVVGLYHEGAQVGFARAVSDGATVAYLADVYVLAAHRGRGLGLALVGHMLEGESLRDVRWLLHTADAQRLYSKLGFVTGPPPYPLMERPRGWTLPAGAGASAVAAAPRPADGDGAPAPGGRPGGADTLRRP